MVSKLKKRVFISLNKNVVVEAQKLAKDKGSTLSTLIEDYLIREIIKKG